jgi:hypothetical protein
MYVTEREEIMYISASHHNSINTNEEVKGAEIGIHIM